MASAWILAVFGYVGHLCLLIAVINRIHSMAISRWLLELIDLAWYVVAILPLFLLWRLDWMTTPWHLSMASTGFHWMLGAYLAVGCGGLAIAVANRPAILKNLRDAPFLVSQCQRIVDLSEEPHLVTECRWSTRYLATIPGNQVFQIAVTDKKFELPELPGELDGITITHLSDLHLTGQLPQRFYRRIAELSNELGSDIVAITGDIVEKVPCLDWLQDTLGDLRAPLGVFFILGNHELRIHDSPRIRRTLTGLGWTDLGGRVATVFRKGGEVHLGGNELPWHSSAAVFPLRHTETGSHVPFRILLSHSPDQFGWAQRQQIDLVLAGHTHGGQIRLPVVGPIFSPSRYGVKYCAGIFYRKPTLMHVSRGIAGTRPLRFQCAPEITKLRLCTPRSS